jgi:hypothetical protein
VETDAQVCGIAWAIVNVLFDAANAAIDDFEAGQGVSSTAVTIAAAVVGVIVTIATAGAGAIAIAGGVISIGAIAAGQGLWDFYTQVGVAAARAELSPANKTAMLENLYCLLQNASPRRISPSLLEAWTAENTSDGITCTPRIADVMAIAGYAAMEQRQIVGWLDESNECIAFDCEPPAAWCVEWEFSETADFRWNQVEQYFDWENGVGPNWRYQPNGMYMQLVLRWQQIPATAQVTRITARYTAYHPNNINVWLYSDEDGYSENFGVGDNREVTMAVDPASTVVGVVMAGGFDYPDAILHYVRMEGSGVYPFSGDPNCI